MREIHIWTDGSAHNNGKYKGLGGNGYLLLLVDKEVDIMTAYEYKHRKEGGEASLDTTNQREEIKAVINGLKQIKEGFHNVVVYSDSAYVVNCMTDCWYYKWRDNGWKNSKKEAVKNRDLWEELIDKVENTNMLIKFKHVKGHSGIPYNETVDDIAGRYTEEMKKKVS